MKQDNWPVCCEARMLFLGSDSAFDRSLEKHEEREPRPKEYYFCEKCGKMIRRTPRQPERATEVTT